MPSSFQPNFSPGDNGNTVGDFFRQFQTNIANGLLDPQSQFFQQFRSFLGSVTPTQGANTLLSGLQAGGGNFGASQVQSQQQQRGFERRRSDFLNTTVKGFASQNIGQALSAIGSAQQSDLSQQQIAETIRNNRANEPGVLDFIGTLAGTALGGFLNPAGTLAGGLGGLFGGGAASAAPAVASAFSDARLKDNIIKVGMSPSGINIYEFNYKNNTQRYRGVMAQEVPEASTEIGGFKAVDYSQIDVNFEAI